MGESRRVSKTRSRREEQRLRDLDSLFLEAHGHEEEDWTWDILETSRMSQVAAYNTPAPRKG